MPDRPGTERRGARRALGLVLLLSLALNAVPLWWGLPSWVGWSYDEILPDATRVAYKYGITLPREFLLILKQLLFFDRYAKLAAPNLNVFSDYYLVDFLFTPAAMEAGLDFNQLMPLLQKVQALTMAREQGESAD